MVLICSLDVMILCRFRGQSEEVRVVKDSGVCKNCFLIQRGCCIAFSTGKGNLFLGSRKAAKCSGVQNSLGRCHWLEDYRGNHDC